jgi:hypothetical protein
VNPRRDYYFPVKELSSDQQNVLRMIRGGPTVYYDDRLSMMKYMPAVIKLVQYGLVTKIGDELTLTPEGEQVARRI